MTAPDAKIWLLLVLLFVFWAVLWGGSETIGDIAAAHGFQSWSRFTQLYRRQLGETPSETREGSAAPSVPEHLISFFGQ